MDLRLRSTIVSLRRARRRHLAPTCGLAALALAAAFAAGCAVKPLPSVVFVTEDEARAMAATGKVTVVETAREAAPASRLGAAAIHLPYTAPIAANKLPADKSRPIVVVGSAPGKTQGVAVANALVEANHREVHYLPLR